MMQGSLFDTLYDDEPLDGALSGGIDMRSYAGRRRESETDGTYGKRQVDAIFPLYEFWQRQ